MPVRLPTARRDCCPLDSLLLCITLFVPCGLDQWHATDFVEEDWLNIKYPMNAPTATASMIQPLYVMKSNLQLLVLPTSSPG